MFLRLPRQMLAISCVMLAACAGGAREQPMAAETGVVCAPPRPEVCTMQYAPVCAFLRSEQRKEYSNACSACSDTDVTSYISGVCP